MNPSTKRSSPSATAAPPVQNKKPKLQTTQSGVAVPQRNIFDAWNSSSTGHQHAENRLSGSTGWRDRRNLKLRAQYKAGRNGGARIADTVGAGSEDFRKDGRKVDGSWERGARGLRKDGQLSLFEAIGRKNKNADAREKEKQDCKDEEVSEYAQSLLQREETGDSRGHEYEEQTSTADEDDPDLIPPSYQPDYASRTKDTLPGDDPMPPKQIFTNLMFYINGSTAPLVSDHKLKYLLSVHGGSLSISHARKTVTHVIIGNPHDYISKGGAGTRGAGGALAGSKIQKEITKTRGKGVKYVSVEWVLESIKAGIRLSEARFVNVKLGGAGQGSVFEQFRASKPGVEKVAKSTDSQDSEV